MVLPAWDGGQDSSLGRLRNLWGSLVEKGDME